MTPKIKEHTCPECNGTGFPVVMQPVQLGHKIYPVKCKSCDGKGKIADCEVLTDGSPRDSSSRLFRKVRG